MTRNLFISAVMALTFVAIPTPSQSKSKQRPTIVLPAPSPTPHIQVVEDIDDGPIKVETQLVSVPVRVMDKKGRFIGGLAKESFKVFENGVEQEIAMFSNERQPFTVALVLDMSYSTKFKIGEIQSAAVAFIDQLRPEDRVMVVSFDSDVHMLCEATSDRRSIYRAIKSTKISTGTSLYEAVDLVINNRLRDVEGRKAIILFSDGVDTTSRRASDIGNLHDVTELDSLIYTIRYDTFSDVQNMKKGRVTTNAPELVIPGTQVGSTLPFPSLPSTGRPGDQGTTDAEYKKAEEYLDQLASRTGGRAYHAQTIGSVTDAYSRIASELREFYSIGYYPSESRTKGAASAVKIKVDTEGVVVRSRATFVRAKRSK
ncbi:MAG: VWA domain-containing protein [Pyrinomonadaceae bacterium]